MAIYKPNNFYPYQQEVDMESLEGNIFSCQVNTNGGLASAAKVKILSSTDGVELYENIYQFLYKDGDEIIKIPYRNKEIAEMKIEPYEIFPQRSITNETIISIDISFQSFYTQIINDNDKYEEKKQMCPYNLYLIKKDEMSYFKIKVQTESGYEYIDLNNFSIIKKDTNLFTITFNNYEDFEKYNNNEKYYIVLKNNYDYLWNVRLYEHYFNEDIDEGTFITDGYVTGSTKNVFWYSDEMNALINEDNVKKDNYVQIIADNTNSDIFKNQIQEGKVMSGNISITENNIDNIIFESNSTNFFTSLCDDGVFRFCNDFIIDENNQVVDNDNIYKLNINGNYAFRGTEEYIGVRYGEYLYCQGNSIYPQWRIIEDVKVRVENGIFKFDFGEFVKFGEEVYRYNISNSSIYSNLDDSTMGDDITWREKEMIQNNKDFQELYRKYPFVVSNCKTHVIARSEDDIINEGFNFNEYVSASRGQIEIISDKKYCIKVLTPVPGHHLFYDVKKDSSNLFEFSFTENVVFCDDEHTDIDCFNRDKKAYNSIISFPHMGYSSTKAEYPIAFLDTKGLNLFNNEFQIKDYTEINFKINNFCSYFLNFKFVDFYGENDATWGSHIPEKKYFTVKFFTNDLFSTCFHQYDVILSDENNLGQEISYNLEIEKPDFLNDCYCKIIFHIYPYYGTNAYYLMNPVCNHFAIRNLQINEKVNNSYIVLNNSVDVNEYINDMYIKFNYTNNVLEEDKEWLYLKNNNVQKIKEYNIFNKNIVLYDSNYESVLLKNYNSEYPITYSLLYKQREKITWVNKKLGYNFNYNKIECQNEFKVNLKNGSEIYLYPCDDENTHNTFFGIKDTDLNVENLYVFFPDYNGKDYLNNELIADVNSYGTKKSDNLTVATTINSSGNYNTKTYTDFVQGNFYSSQPYYSINNNSGNEISPSEVTLTYWTNELCPWELYGTNVREEAFNIKDVEDENKITNKLFKVVSYDPQTGEFVLSGGLGRVIQSSDRYEIWEKEYIEGSSNEYDITEVSGTYTRLYPDSQDVYKDAYVNNEDTILEIIRILNSDEGSIFIQPNVNFSSDNNCTPYLIIDQTENRLNFPYDSRFFNSDFNLQDTTIEKLDNSQWLLKYNSNQTNKLIPGMSYKLYTDWLDSTPSSYFYARDIGDVELKYDELSNVDRVLKSKDFSILDYDDLFENSLCEFNKDFDEDGNYLIKGMNIFLLVKINNIKTQIKKYRYKIYNESMNLLYDSLDIWDNIMKFKVEGLNSNEIYYLYFECEDELGYEYFYEHSFISLYQKQQIDADIAITELCNQTAINIQINSLPDSTVDGFDLSNKINIYRKDSSGRMILINTIDTEVDKKYIDKDSDKYVYNFIDYNVINHEYYDYIFILGMSTLIDFNDEDYLEYSYTISSASIKTNFDSWSIVNIIKNEDTGFYEAIGDVWLFKYNLESSDIVNNTSVTTWNTLGKYAQLGYGERGYDSSGLTCLLGDISNYTVLNKDKEVERYGYHEKTSDNFNNLNQPNYTKGRSNNIDKYKNWKKFCRSMDLKLLKDISGNKWIVGIMENPNTNINDKSKEQMKTISFQWMEVMDSDNISVIKK